MTATMTCKKEKGRLVNEGMGGFLNPPGHPEHNWSVETDLRRRPENRGRMSLSAAVESEWLDGAARSAAKSMLTRWQTGARLPIDSPEVVKWIRQVLGYFRNCYKNPAAGERQWHVGELIIDQKRDPLNSPWDHAGVNLIRRYYPEYVPTQEDFDNAKWGS